MSSKNLEGIRVLIVEDDFYQALDMSECLTAAGAEVVGPAGQAGRVADIISDQSFDAAVVDINLGTGPDFDIARTLRERNVPFLFLTGYDLETIPADLAATPRVQKPVRSAEVLQGLIRLIRR